MKVFHLILFFVTVLVLMGCHSKYRATAHVRLDFGHDKPQQVAINREIEAIRRIVPSFVSVDEGYEVKRVNNSSAISVSVITSDPEISASACNQIVQKYVNIVDRLVSKEVVKTASVPRPR